MSNLDVLGIGPLHPFDRDDRNGTEYVQVQRPLQRVMAFRGRSIDDVVNSPLIKNEIYGYWKLYRQIQRHSEVVDLERQWNPLGTRT
jgi:aromatic ring hydroxylase